MQIQQSADDQNLKEISQSVFSSSFSKSQNFEKRFLYNVSRYLMKTVFRKYAIVLSTNCQSNFDDSCKLFKSEAQMNSSELTVISCTHYQHVVLFDCRHF